MVVRNSLLQRGRKLQGKSAGLEYTIQLLDEYISIILMVPAKHKKYQGRLDIDSLRMIEALAHELRDPDYLMIYFERLIDLAEYDLIELSLDQNIIINLRSIQGDFFPYPIQTIQINSLLERIIHTKVHQQIELLRQQFLKRQQSIREALWNRAKQNIQSKQQDFSLCFKAFTIIIFFFILFIVIQDQHSNGQKLILDNIVSKTHFQQRLKNLIEKTKNSTLKPNQLINLQQNLFKDIADTFAEQLYQLKKQISLEMEMIQNLNQEVQNEKKEKILDLYLNKIHKLVDQLRARQKQDLLLLDLSVKSNIQEQTTNSYKTH